MYLSEWWLYISLHLQIVLWSILGKKCPSHVKTQTPSMCGILTYIYRKNQFSFSDIQLVLLCSTVGGKGRMNKAGTFAFSNSFWLAVTSCRAVFFWKPDTQTHLQATALPIQGFPSVGRILPILRGPASFYLAVCWTRGGNVLHVDQQCLETQIVRGKPEVLDGSGLWYCRHPNFVVYIPYIECLGTTHEKFTHIWVRNFGPRQWSY